MKDFHELKVWQKAHALWVLERLKALGPELVQLLAADPKRGVRVHLWKALAERKSQVT